MVDRRSLAKWIAAGTVIFGTTTGLSSCPITPSNAVQTAVSLIQALANGWAQVSTFIGTIPGVSASVLQSIGAGIATLQTLASQAIANWSTSGSDILTKVFTIAAQLAATFNSLGLGVTIPGVVLTVLSAMPSAIEFLEGLWSQLFPSTPAPTPTSIRALVSRRYSAMAPMTPAQIIAILNNPFAATQ